MQMECMKHERPNLKKVLLKLRSEISYSMRNTVYEAKIFSITLCKSKNENTPSLRTV